MSNAYYEKSKKKPAGRTSADMRKHCQRPGNIGEDGLPIYFTEQSHQKETEIKYILSKYDKTGLIQHVSKFEARFGDATGLDFKEATDLVIAAKESFSQLPAEVKKRFDQDPGKLLEFFEDENNRDEAIKLGLISPKWTIDTDGLGEHVPLGGNIEKEKDVTPPEKTNKESS